MNGEVLDFRLYNDGTVEYDEYSTQSLPGKILKAKEIKKIKRTKISDSELKEILNIISELENTTSDFTESKICTDASIDTNITLRRNSKKKTIAINSHCTNLSDKNSTSYSFKNFPAPINALFQKLRTIRLKESSGKFYH